MMNKRSWPICTILPLAAAVLLAGIPAGRAQTPPPQKIDVSKLKYKEGNDVVIPVPAEIFKALDNQGGSPNWHGVLLPTSTLKPHSPPEIAMLLGTVIANGFVAVEAKDKGAVDEIGRKVIELATGLGVKDAVIHHCNAIINAAKDDNWNTVRTELDKAQSSVSSAMNALHSQDEARLISIAGWLRGTQALTTLIAADYKPERAELLHQPDMLTTFETQFGTMEPKVQANKLVTQLRDGLKKVKPLILSSGNEPLPDKAVQQINVIVTDLVKAIAP